MGNKCMGANKAKHSEMFDTTDLKRNRSKIKGSIQAVANADPLASQAQTTSDS